MGGGGFLLDRWFLCLNEQTGTCGELPVVATGGGGAGHLGRLPRGAGEPGMPASILPALDVCPARVRGEGCEQGPQATRRGREHGKEP